MKHSLMLALLVASPVFAPIPALGELSEAAQLRLQCEEERQQQITPLREKEIEDCVTKGGSQEDCEQKHLDYGNAGRTVTGGLRPRMFDDLPSCIAAREAEQAEEQVKRQERTQGEAIRDTDPGAIRDSSAATTTRDSSTGTTTRDSSTGTTTRGSSTGTNTR